jgi:4-hydroxy-3-polyprenylbenzoate decarboxylase
MVHLKSLRDHIEQLRSLGEIQDIDVEVDWNLEMGAIIRRSYELRAPAPLFHRIKGIEPGFRVLGAPAGVSRQKGMSLARVALSLGFPPTATGQELVEALAQGYQKPSLPPRRVTNAPCKENKLLGRDVDLYRLPAPLIHDGDGGRYLNTWGTMVVRTPDGKWTNWSITRIMVTDKNTMAGGVIPTQHLGIIYQRWKELGRATPFALAIGTEPAIPFISGMPLDENINEADFLGGYLGEPVDVVPAETVDLDVPATSEIVIEGHLSADTRVHEGPMGEYSGYLMPGGGMSSPVFQVSALTYRNQPILPVVAAGEPIEENHTCWGIGVSAQILWELRRQNFPVTACFAPFESAAHWLVVTVPQRAYQDQGEGLIRDLGRIVFGCRAGGYMPKILLMADDVDPTNLDEVTWAFATRCRPDTGTLLFPKEGVLPLVAFLDSEERKAARGTKVIYNCLLPPQTTPAIRSSFRHAWPRELQEKVIANWSRYGYRD